MKKNKLIGLLCLIVAIVFNSSCSESGKMNELLENIPDKTDVVFVGNIKAIVESAGGTMEDSKIKLPSYLTSALPRNTADDWDEAMSFFKKSGINTEMCAIMTDYKDGRPVYVFSLDDKKKFIEAIEDNGYKEKSSEGDVAIYSKKVYEGSDSDYDDYGYIAVNGSCAYWIESVWVGSDFKPISYLERVIENAKESSFAATPYADYMLEGNVGGLYVSFPREFRNELKESGVPSELVSLYDGSFCMRGELTDNKCTLNFKLFDEEGKEVSMEKFSKFMDTSATINKKALAMLGKDETMICAMSMKNIDWDNYSDMIASSANLSRSDRATFNAIMSYFEKIDGTVAWGFGLTHGLESIRKMKEDKDAINQFSTTIVLETKEGKAKQIIDDMKGFLEKSGVPFDDNTTGLSIDLEKVGLSGNIYVKNIDNFIVMANHPINEDNDNELVKDTNFADYLFAFCIGLNKNNELMKDVNIKNDVKLGLHCKPNTAEASVELEIDGDDGSGIVEKAARIIIKLVDQAGDFDRRFGMGRSQEDYVEIDTVAVEEDYVVDSVAAY